MTASVGSTGIFVGSPKAWEVVCKRASGCRDYNAIQHIQMLARRHDILRLWLAYLELGAVHGVRARIARDVGVSKPAVCKDIRVILRPPAAW